MAHLNPHPQIYKEFGGTYAEAMGSLKLDGRIPLTTQDFIEIRLASLKTYDDVIEAWSNPYSTVDGLVFNNDFTHAKIVRRSKKLADAEIKTAAPKNGSSPVVEYMGTNQPFEEVEGFPLDLSGLDSKGQKLSPLERGIWEYLVQDSNMLNNYLHQIEGAEGNVGRQMGVVISVRDYTIDYMRTKNPITAVWPITIGPMSNGSTHYYKPGLSISYLSHVGHLLVGVQKDKPMDMVLS